MLKTRKPTPEDVAFVKELKDAMRAVVDAHPEIDAQVMLAGAAQVVGNLIALQDQRKVTPEMAMAVVAANIEAGNTEAINGLLGTPAQGRA